MLKEVTVWGVTYVSRDDGSRVVAHVFSKQGDADRFCRSLTSGDDQRVVKTTIWQDDCGIFYEITKKQVSVDAPLHRESGLAKLTPAERAALGV